MKGRLIGLFFGLLWLFVGASGAPKPVGIAMAGICLALFALAAWRVIRVKQDEAPLFTRAYYIAAVIAEIVAIAAAQRWLAASGQRALLWPVVGLIVGLHFIGLWLAVNDRRFLWLSGVMVALNIAALLIPMPTRGRTMLSGFGSSAALLIAASA